MKHSLSFKMMFMTMTAFALLIIGMVVTLSIYFNFFYESQKVNGMIDAIAKFKTEYVESKWNKAELYKEVKKFMNNHNATMSISTYELDVMNIPIYASRSIFMNEAEIGILAKLGKNEVNYDMVTLTMNDNDIVFAPMGESNLESLEKKGIQYVHSEISDTNIQQVDFSTAFMMRDGTYKEIYVNVSLQSVDEALNIFNRFIPYLVGFAVVLSFLMALVYSRTVSKPIVAITAVAKRMSKMELGIQSKVFRKDELGQLSGSLNTLSFNLKQAHDELTIANNQLQLDYDQKLNQELVRKEFIANVSHELKTPLGVIKGYAEGIIDCVREDKREYFLEVILDEVDKMDDLIQDMLEISKHDAGVVLYSKEKQYLLPLIEHCLSAFEPAMIANGMSYEIIGENSLVVMDENRIGSVVSNLISNAVKYSNMHSEIEIILENVEELCIFSILNDCEQFSDELLEKIWDRFYKIDTSRNRCVEGTGLGLAITKSILEGHECPYGVKKTEKGLLFWFGLKRGFD